MEIDIVQDSKRVEQIVTHLNLFDDVFMSRVFNKNNEATELLLGVILGRNIKVISVESQVEYRNPIVGGRNIVLDIKASTEEGELFDVEVQNDAEGSSVRRARYHSSMIDASMLVEGDKFKKLKDSYVIFIYAKDKFNEGKPIYHIDRVVEETGLPFGDGSHIIYVNGTYKGKDPVGKLIEDFHRVDNEEYNYDILGKSVKHFRQESEEQNMNAEIEQYAQDVAQNTAQNYGVQVFINMIKEGYSEESAIKVTGLGKEMVEKAHQIMNQTA